MRLPAISAPRRARGGPAPSLGLLLGAGLVLGAAMLAGGTGSPGVLPETALVPQPAWEPAYSRQFPGCVATVLWPGEETPAAVVVLDPEGEVARLDLDDARAAARMDGQKVIGVCRERPGR